MTKRIPLSERRAKDARGVDVIFGGAPTPEVSVPEEASNRTEEPASVLPPLPGAGATSEESSNEGSSNENSSQETPPKPVLAKVTIYIRPEQVIAIESIQLVQRQRTGKKPDKSDLLQEAVDLLIAKYQG